MLEYRKLCNQSIEYESLYVYIPSVKLECTFDCSV